MKHTPEYYASKPNLLRIARELASYGKDSRRVTDTLMVMIAAYAAQKPAEPVQATADNNQRFNDLLNSYRNPQATFDELMVLAAAEKGEQA